MTEPTTHTTPSPETPGTRPARCRGRGRIAFFAVMLAVLAGATGFLASKAMSHGHGFGGHFMHGPIDPATAGKRAERAMRHLAIEVDATPEQTQKLVAIAQSAVRDLLPLREQLVAGRGEIRDALLATSVDRNVIEKMRTDKLALIDQATRRMTQALAEASEILSPEQRRQLAGRIEQFREMRGFRGWMHRG